MNFVSQRLILNVMCVGPMAFSEKMVLAVFGVSTWNI